MFYEGWGTTVDYGESFALFSRAADHGDPQGKYSLAILYENGRGVPEDLGQAQKLYAEAAIQFPTSDAKDRALAIQGRDRVAALLGSAHVADDKTVSVVQTALIVLGFDTGSADGQLGPKTEAAIRQYEVSVGIPQDGQVSPSLLASLQTALVIAKRQKSPTPAVVSQPLKLAATGSGFYLSNAGILLTNYHVVEGCKSVSTPNGNVSVIAADRQNDLAVLSTPPRTGGVGALRVGPIVRAGERVVVVGFPLAGFLAAQANVTTGDVSSLAGIRDDSRYLQITAPVQPGNSGGPLFDSSGNIIGVVSAKLDAIKVAGVTGDIPENVNFAINVSVVRAFLDSHGIAYQTATSVDERSSPDIGDWGKSITQLVECWH